MLQSLYGKSLQAGFTLFELQKASDETNPQSKLNKLITATYDPSDTVFGVRFKFSETDVSSIQKILVELGSSSEAISKILMLHEKSVPSASQVEEQMLNEIPELHNFKLHWRKTIIQQSGLTAIGLVMAHSALQSRSSFNSPLSAWFQ